MNPLVPIRLECLRLAQTQITHKGDVYNPDPHAVIESAKAYEKHVRRGIRTADLGGGCGCGGGKATSQQAKRARQAMLDQDAKAMIDARIDTMSLAALVTDYDLIFPQADAERIDAALAKLSLRRNVTGTDLAKWIETGSLPGGRKQYVPT